MPGGRGVGAGIASLIGVLIFIVVATNLISPIITAITDASGLAVLGSVSGGSALVLLIATVFIAGLVALIVNMFFPGVVTGAVQKVTAKKK